MLFAEILVKLYDFCWSFDLYLDDPSLALGIDPDRLVHRLVGQDENELGSHCPHGSMQPCRERVNVASSFDVTDGNGPVEHSAFNFIDNHERVISKIGSPHGAVFHVQLIGVVKSSSIIGLTDAGRSGPKSNNAAWLVIGELNRCRVINHDRFKLKVVFDSPFSLNLVHFPFHSEFERFSSGLVLVDPRWCSALVGPIPPFSDVTYCGKGLFDWRPVSSLQFSHGCETPGVLEYQNCMSVRECWV
jgi:hypothetical protein